MHPPAADVYEDVRLRLLGGFRVSVGRRVVEDGEWRLRKAKSLVKLLALTPGHRLHRERAMDLLWPDLNTAASANNLRGALHVARRALEPVPANPLYLQSRDDMLALCPDSPLWVDVEAFEEAAATARRSRDPAAYRAALDLYAGELLPEDLYEQWAEERREELRGSYLELLLGLARAHEARDEREPAVEALRRVVAVEPATEAAHVGLMRLYALSGQRGEALKQYERVREVLRRELDAEPDPATRRLRDDVAAGRPLPAGSHIETRLQTRETPVGDRHNLPASLSSFIGREQEITRIKRDLAMTRLLTLTGAGGSGKTRLALEAAREIAGLYPDGAWLVELAGLPDGNLVLGEVASVLGIREQPGHPPLDTLVSALRGRRMLLILDNCEHLIEATARLAETLLSFCPELRILATSREPLGVAGETNRVVPPLSMPDPRHRATTEELMAYESVRLFMDRAERRNPAFVPTPENAQSVAEICQKLDGIPLAIELAASRVGLSPDQIVERLTDSLGLLTTSSRTASPRQRTLRGTLGWSYDLLTEPERDLFERLSVFAGGWTLEAAEAVGAGARQGEILDLLSGLVDKSLVIAGAARSGAPRYRMLEPVRQYARERLDSSEEVEEVRRRHAAFFLDVAERAEPELRGPRQVEWLEQLEREQDNFRAALAYLFGRGDAELALRLAGAMGGFWPMRGHLDEGRRWLEAALARAEGPPAIRAKVLGHASWIAWEQLDYEGSAAFSEEHLALARELGDDAGAATAVFFLGIVAMSRIELERARELLEEAATFQRATGDRAGLARSLQALGLVAVAQHAYERAATLHEESLALDRETHNDYGIVLSLGQGALTAIGNKDHERARMLCTEGLELSRRTGNVHGVVFYLHILAVLSSSQGLPVRSARLWGAAEALSDSLGITLQPVERYHYGPYIEAARTLLGEAAWEAAWAEGKTLTPERATEYALSEEEPAPLAPAPEKSSAGTRALAVTAREKEVAGLVARGLTNRSVAEELHISESTVEKHVANTLRKLGLRSRAQIAAWATEQGLFAPNPD